jgi:beta-mannosidase
MKPRAVIFCAVFATILPAAQPKRFRQVLADGWTVQQRGSDSAPLRARMPAQVHEILLANKLIPDPHVSRNAAASAWVGTKDWVYTCKFATPAGLPAQGPVFLFFGGLDTLATASLNGARIGSFSDMYREYRVEVRAHLKPAGAENTLTIVFASPLEFIDKYPQPAAHVGIIPKFKYVRKSHGDFSSYLGAAPNSVKVGIFRDVVLDAPGASWIEDVWVRPELTGDYHRATVRVRVETAGAPASLEWTLLDPSGAEAGRGTAQARGPAADFQIDVRDPKLWWPRTHGTPNLYRLAVRLTGAGGLLDAREMNVGMRQVRPVLSDPATGEKRFRFEVNGRPVYLMGADLAPVEGATHCWTPDRAARLFELAEQGRMNIIRVWAEGNEPPQSFYDECDRRGILVWQDFMFGYGLHPFDIPAFAENARAEIEGMVRRLRNHPSLLLWVGGNENQMGADFAGVNRLVGTDLFEKVMPEICARLDPTRLFHPSSPYGGRVANWPLEGDWHDYTTLTFSPEASVPLYASEIGRVSAPSLGSMRRFLREEELWPKDFSAAIREPGQAAWPPMWQYRSVDGSWDKVGPIEQYPDAATAEDLIRVLGTAHGEYLQNRVERQRRGVPDGAPDGNRRNWGTMVWRLNDSWPILYWSVIDYYGEPKIPYYFLRRAYDPVLVSFERTPDRIGVWVVNDSAEAVAGKLVVRKMRFDGTVRAELSAEVKVGPAQSKRCLDLTDFGTISLREEFLDATFADREATAFLGAERYLHLPAAKLQARMEAGKIRISTDRFARQVSLEMEGVTGAAFEDNFFDLAPGRSRTIAVTYPAGGHRIKVKALNAPPAALDLGN